MTEADIKGLSILPEKQHRKINIEPWKEESLLQHACCPNKMCYHSGRPQGFARFFGYNVGKKGSSWLDVTTQHPITARPSFIKPTAKNVTPLIKENSAQSCLI